MNTFIDDESYYKTGAEYKQKKNEFNLMMLEKKAELIDKKRFEFTSENLPDFCAQFTLLTCPILQNCDVRERTLVYRSEKEMMNWLAANRTEPPKTQREYVEDKQREKQKITEQMKKERQIISKQWMSKNYIASADFFEPLSYKELCGIVERLPSNEARLIADGNLENCGCILWGGVSHHKTGIPWFNRIRTRKQGKRGGYVRALFYNFLVQNIKARDTVVNTCNNPMCVNPLHCQLIDKRSLKRKRK